LGILVKSLLVLLSAFICSLSVGCGTTALRKPPRRAIVRESVPFPIGIRTNSSYEFVGSENSNAQVALTELSSWPLGVIPRIIENEIRPVNARDAEVRVAHLGENTLYIIKDGNAYCVALRNYSYGCVYRIPDAGIFGMAATSVRTKNGETAAIYGIAADDVRGIDIISGKAKISITPQNGAWVKKIPATEEINGIRAVRVKYSNRVIREYIRVRAQTP
jgi:hypothetical protein